MQLRFLHAEKLLSTSKICLRPALSYSPTFLHLFNAEYQSIASYQLVSSLCIPQEIVGAHDLLPAVSNTKQCCTLNFLGSPTGFRGVTDLDMRSANGYSELIRGT